MGITIHYRGKLDDLSQVEAIEDRLIDLTLALGERYGSGGRWRTAFRRLTASAGWCGG